MKFNRNHRGKQRFAALVIASTMAATGVSGVASAQAIEPQSPSIAAASSVDLITTDDAFNADHADALRLYFAFFDRSPDLEGAKHWIAAIDAGATLDEVAHYFSLSQEFINTYAGTTDDEFITAVYQNVLDREPEQEGFDYWKNLLETEQLTRWGVVRFVAANQEFENSHRFLGELDDAKPPAGARSTIDLSFEGLEPLGPDFEYELWTVADGAPVTGGIFDIDADGNVVFSSDQNHFYAAENATDVVISIEPAVDPDPAPAAAKPLGGTIAADGTFELTTSHPAAFGTDFSDAAGTYILATPSDGNDTNELSGLWFLRLGSSGPEASLELPELPEGWVYEGWAVSNGTPISTGTFTDGAAADNFSGFTGEGNVPNYPGEDFLVNAPDGLTFPLNLQGGAAVISVEPADDNSPAPFALKPLVGNIPADAADHVNYDLGTGPAPFSGSGVVRPGIDLSFTGLESLGPDFEYELWTVVDGAPVTGGIFDIDADGNVVFAEGHSQFVGSNGATDVVISIEPAVDPDPAPAAAKPLGGPIAADGSFQLTTSHPAAFGTDFSDAAGTYILATPSDGNDTNELSGLWFLRLDDGPKASLELPELPEGWVYEGWSVSNGTPISTGTFTDGTGPDDFNGFTGPGGVPPFPGEDFLVNAPAGLTFPLNLQGGAAVISVEPADDNSPAPFALKPLVGPIDGDAVDHVNYDLGTGPAPFSGEGSQSAG